MSTDLDSTPTDGPFTVAEYAYLDSEPLGRLATVAADGAPQVNPVGFAYNRATRTIDIGGFSMSTSRKFRNVAATGRAAFVVDDVTSTDPWRVRFLEIRGEAEALTDPADSAVRVPGAIIRIHPRRVIAFAVEDPSQGPRDATPAARSV